MFTGLVTAIGTVSAVSDAGQLRRVRINSPFDPGGIALGASIACGGPCLTVVAVEAGQGGCRFEVDVAAETLSRTNAAAWTVGTHLNLERSLKIGDELGGHIVTGHIDGLAEILDRVELTSGVWGQSVRFELRAPNDLARFIAEKGSVALDGTSLTVNDVAGDRFSVLIIPHTVAVTTWGERRSGDSVNLEVDLMARYAARLAETRAQD